MFGRKKKTEDKFFEYEKIFNKAIVARLDYIFEKGYCNANQGWSNEGNVYHISLRKDDGEDENVVVTLDSARQIEEITGSATGLLREGNIYAIFNVLNQIIEFNTKVGDEPVVFEGEEESLLHAYSDESKSGGELVSAGDKRKSFDESLDSYASKGMTWSLTGARYNLGKPASNAALLGPSDEDALKNEGPVAKGVVGAAAAVQAQKKKDFGRDGGASNA